MGENSTLGNSKRKLKAQELDFLLEEALQINQSDDKSELKSIEAGESKKIILKTHYLNNGPHRSLESTLQNYKENSKYSKIELIIPLTDSANTQATIAGGHIKTLRLMIEYTNNKASKCTAIFYDPKYKTVAFSGSAETAVRKALGLHSFFINWTNQTPNLFFGTQQLPLNFSDCGYYAYELCLGFFNNTVKEDSSGLVCYTKTEEDRKLLFIKSRLIALRKNYGDKNNNYELFLAAANSLLTNIKQEQPANLKKSAAINVLYQMMFLPREEDSSSRPNPINLRDSMIVVDEEIYDNDTGEFQKTNSQAELIKKTENLLTNKNLTMNEISEYLTLSQQYQNTLSGNCKDTGKLFGNAMLFLLGVVLIGLIGISLWSIITATTGGTLSLPALAFIGLVVEETIKAYAVYAIGVTVVTAVATVPTYYGATGTATTLTEIYSKRPSNHFGEAMKELTHKSELTIK